MYAQLAAGPSLLFVTTHADGRFLALVVLHISRNGQTGTTNRVVQDAIDKVCYACNERTCPVRVGTLTYGPLQNV